MPQGKNCIPLEPGRSPDLDHFQFEFANGVHFGFDDADGFFNPASRAFAALRLSACSLPSIGTTCDPASCAFAALRLSACSFPSIGTTCDPARCALSRPRCFG